MHKLCCFSYLCIFKFTAYQLSVLVNYPRPLFWNSNLLCKYSRNVSHTSVKMNQIFGSKFHQFGRNFWLDLQLQGPIFSKTLGMDTMFIYKLHKFSLRKCHICLIVKVIKNLHCNTFVCSTIKLLLLIGHICLVSNVLDIRFRIFLRFLIGERTAEYSCIFF